MVVNQSFTTFSDIDRIYNLQKSNYRKVGKSTAKERILKLKNFMKAIYAHRENFHKAMWLDFHKPAAEVDITEIYPVVSEIKFAIKNLKKWMRTKKVGTPMAMLGSSSYVKFEPKGLCLIIAPWNYPMQLLFAPLVSAIAAGNSVILKPSEFTTHTVDVMKKIVSEVFNENEIATVEGAVEETQHLLALKFDHIFFTGAPVIGKIIMEKAAQHLTSVTLELGGKSPTIIDDTAQLKKIVPRIAWAKFINAGQICLAPDYVLVHESKKNEFVDLMKKQLVEHYGEDASKSDFYVQMINDRHFNRVKGYLDNSVKAGASIVFGGKCDAENRFICPTLVDNIPLDCDLMENEIFGPILPIVSFKTNEEAIEIIHSKEKPLGLYIYSKNKKNIDYFLENTSAGGTCINHSTVHIGNPNLPFGGVNNSGIGKSHGYYGFVEFSNERAILKQNLKSATELLSPPYNSKFKQKLIDITLKWL